MRLFARLAVFAAVATWAGMAAASDGSAETAVVIVQSVKPQSPSRAGVVNYGLTRDDYRRIITTVPTIRRAIPVRQTTAKARYRGEVADVMLIGTTETFAAAHKLEVARGRFLTEKDLKQRKNVAVISREIARKLFLDEDPIGKNLRMERNYFLIVGVVSKASALPPAEDSDRRGDAEPQVFVPLSTMRSRLGDVAVKTVAGSSAAEQYELSRIEIAVEDPAKIEATADLIRRILQASHEKADYSVEIAGQSTIR
ncbi:MAG: ABC transporter permease [Planctomycetes bacterium]|nr:ABC transporter permease [Planctomycetota bacterium]